MFEPAGAVRAITSWITSPTFTRILKEHRRLRGGIEVCHTGLNGGGARNGTDIIVDGGMIGGRMYTPHQESLKQMRTASQVPGTTPVRQSPLA